MKKCPYCAEEIQDEAIFCRWCQHDLTGYSQVSKSNPDDNDVNDHKRQRGVFWRALLFGVGMGTIIFGYRMSQPTQLPEYGDTGKLNDAFFGGLSSVFIYGGIYSLVVWIKRAIVKNETNIPRFSSRTGFASLVVFMIGLGFYFIFMVIGGLGIFTHPIAGKNSKPTQSNTIFPTSSSVITSEACHLKQMGGTYQLSFTGENALEICNNLMKKNKQLYTSDDPLHAGVVVCAIDDKNINVAVFDQSRDEVKSKDLCKELTNTSANTTLSFHEWSLTFDFGALNHNLISTPSNTIEIPLIQPSAQVLTPTIQPTLIDVILDITIKVENRCPERHVVIMDGPIHLKYDVAPGATVEWQGARGVYSWTIDGITSAASPQELTSAVWTLTLCD